MTLQINLTLFRN